MAPTPGPVSGAIGKLGLENSNFGLNQRKSTTVTTKGLLNMPGQNNCFLNSAVQVLWHLDAFRRSFREQSGHSCMAESCIFCALKELFMQFQYSQESALPPDALRHALANTFCDQRRFQLGFMDDAAECFENILLRIHVHIANQEADDMCGNPYCIPHQKFAMTLVEQRICQSCPTSSEPLPFTQMVHYVTTSALCTKSIEMQQQDTNCQISSFGKLLRLAGEMGEVRECPSGCGEKIQAKKTLMNHPEVVSIGLVWDSECPTLQHITDVFHSIGLYLQLQDMFHDVCDTKWGNATVHQLVGVVTYYGKHYSTFFFHTKLRVWIYFDDATVQEVGPSWEQVVEKCQRGRFQPLLLLYASPDGSGGGTVYRDNTYSNIQSLESNNKPSVNLKQAVINQYLTLQNLKRMANVKSSYGHMRNSPIYANNIVHHDSYTYNAHVTQSQPSYHPTSYTAIPYSHSVDHSSHPQSAPVYSNLQYLNMPGSEHQMMTSKPPSPRMIPSSDVQSYSFDFQRKDKIDFDAAKDSDSAYTEEDPEVNDMYISRKAVESVLKHQKQHMSLCRSYSQSSVGNRNSSSSLESFDHTLNSKVNVVSSVLPENIVVRRDSGSWSSDRNSSASNNSVENPFLTVVASKRLLLGLNKKGPVPDSNTSDHGYDSFSVSSSDSYPSVNGSPVKLEPRLTQIPEDWQPEPDTDLDQKLKLITEDAAGPPDCDKLCAEADLLLAKSHEKERDGDLVMAALLSDSAAARARAAMEAPYNNSRSLVSAKMKHSTCVMRSSNLYRRLKDHEIDERRKLKGHHSRQSSRDSTHSRHSRQNSKDSTHSKAGSKDSNPNSDDTENFGKNIEIYGTLPKKGSRKKNASTSSLKVKDDQVYKDFLDKQRKNTNLSNELNETMLKNVDLPKTRSDFSPKRKVQTADKSKEVSPKSPTRKKDLPPKSDTETRKKPSQVPCPSVKNKGIDFNSRDLLSPIPSPDKKPHKIKRKLMGGFMKRKNRSLPDLREDPNSTDPMGCFLDDAIIPVPSMTLPNNKSKKPEIDSREVNKPHHAFIKKVPTQRPPLLVKVSPPNIQSPIISPKTKLIHTLPALPKKSSDITSKLESVSSKPSKIPLQTLTLNSQKNDLPPIPPFRSVDTKCSSKVIQPQKTSAIPVLSPQIHLSPIKPSNSPRTEPTNEQSNDKEDLPLPLNPFLAEIQAKRKQVLNKSLEKQKQLEPVNMFQQSSELSMLPKLALHGEGTSWLKELQSKQQQFLNRPDNVEEMKPIRIIEKLPVKLTNYKVVTENNKEPSTIHTHTMNWKLPSESSSEVVSSPSIGGQSSSNTSNSVKDLASRFEKVLILPKETSTHLTFTDEPPNVQKKDALTNSPEHNENHFKASIPQCPAVETNTQPLKSALKSRTDYNNSCDSPVSNVSVVADIPIVKSIKSALKQTPPYNPTPVQTPLSNGNALPRPMQPPDYATAMQRREQIRTNTTDNNFQQDQTTVGVQEPKKKQGSKKSVTFSDEVVLVACAEYDEIDFSSNPLFERVYQAHVESGKGEIPILSSAYGNYQTSEGNANYTDSVDNSNSGTASCNLCHSKQASTANGYCSDCEFYLSRFKA